jgi:hypothetical protein
MKLEAINNKKDEYVWRKFPKLAASRYKISTRNTIV